MLSTREPTKPQVLEQLERIVRSADFDTSERSREFLRFVVEETLEGRDDGVTQHHIATRVFGRRGDFDPTVDPIVRMQAGRVRRALEHYYLTGGANDPLVIEIPRGGYVPQFRHADVADARPTLLVAPLSNATRDPGLDFLAQGLASDLAIELDRYGHVDVFLDVRPGAGPRERPPTRFVVEGSIASLEAALKISIRLVDVDSGKQLWGQHYRYEGSALDLERFLDELAQTLAATLADERGVLPRHVSRQLPARSPEQAGAYEAILRFYHFDVSPTLSSFHEALAALKHAVEIDPEYGLAWAHLARLYATNYALELFEGETPIDEALAFAGRGAGLDPLDHRTRLTKAFVHLLRGDVDEGRLETEEAFALAPDSLFFLDGVGYLLTLFGDWERGPELSRRAVSLNPCHRDVVHAGLWLDAVRREDYPLALHEAESFLSGIFWQPLMRAVALAYLDRVEEGSRQIEQLLQLKPDFRERGRWLVARYVKFDDLEERIARGIGRLGLELT